MKKYDIKPDHHIRAKRASLTGLTIGLEKCPGRGERSDMAAAVRRVILEVSETDATVKTETN